MKRANGRQLKDLVSIGPAMGRDFELLGIRTVEELAQHRAEELYDRLCKLTRQHHDICVLDTFHAAVAQARNPGLPAAQRQWWYYSRKRLAQAQKTRKSR